MRPSEKQESLGFSRGVRQGMFLAENADHLTKTAHELYEAVMGRPAETEPEIMCVWTEY